MHYDSLRICRGDSFPLQKFMKNEVEVPIGFSLLGWHELDGDFFVPKKDTTLLLQYQKDGGSAVYKLPFVLLVQDPPSLRLPSKNMIVCQGTSLDDVFVESENCDLLYWEDLRSGEKHLSLSEFDWNGQYEGSRVFQVVGSNEFCTSVAMSQLEVGFISSEQFRVAVNMPEDVVKICGDSLLLCEYVRPDLLKVYYEDELVERYPYGAFSYEVSWVEKDSFTDCEKYAKAGLERDYWIEAEIKEDRCGNQLKLAEKHTLKLMCEADGRPDFKLSASCKSGYWEVYWGTKNKVLSVTLEPLQEGEYPEPVISESAEYDFETFLYPYKGSARICWQEKSGEIDYIVSLKCLNEAGRSVTFQDTLSLNACFRETPMILQECLRDENKTMVHIGSNDSIMEVSFNQIEEGSDFEESDERNHLGNKFSFVESYTFLWTEALPDTQRVEVKISRAGCAQERVESSYQIQLEKCFEKSLVFYGAYTSPHAILQQKEECSRRQCFNYAHADAMPVRIVLECFGDTVYFKFKGVGIHPQEEYSLRIKSEEGSGFNVFYPHEYEKRDDGEFVFRNVDVMNPTLFFVPTENCVVEGELEGVPFLFEVEIVGEKIRKETSICQGDTLELYDMVEGGHDGLSWNVQQTKVSPLKDTEYYLYGFTESGCLVDEKVVVRIKHPIWFQTAQEEFCEGTLLDLKAFVHTNAEEIFWGKGEGFFSGNELVELRLFQTIELTLRSACDTMVVDLPIMAKKCDENGDFLEKEEKPDLESKSGRLKILTHFSPDGDGVNDEWVVESDRPPLYCYIYDRFGKIMKVFENEPVVWDGFYNGVLQFPTDYWYEMKFEGNEELKCGHFTLLKR